MADKKRKWSGLGAKSFARGVRWKLDQDYLDKLSDEEREWLHRFNDVCYNAKWDKEFCSVEILRSCNADKTSARRDLYSGASPAYGGHLGEWAPDESDIDEESPPPHLDSAEYKSQVAAFRAEIDQARKNRTPKPKPLKVYYAVKNPKQPVVNNDLPVVEFISGPVKTSKGWQIFRVVINNHKVLEEEALCEPTSRLDALGRMQVEIASRYFAAPSHV